MKPSTKQQLWSIIRGLAKAAGGALAANGINSDSIQQVFIGVATAVIGFIFSFINHARDKETPAVNPIKLQ